MILALRATCSDANRSNQVAPHRPCHIGRSAWYRADNHGHSRGRSPGVLLTSSMNASRECAYKDALRRLPRRLRRRGTRTVVAQHGPHRARKPVPKPWRHYTRHRGWAVLTDCQRDWTGRLVPGHHHAAPSLAGLAAQTSQGGTARHPRTTLARGLQTGEGGPRTVAHQIRHLEFCSCSDRLTIYDSGGTTEPAVWAMRIRRRIECAMVIPMVIQSTRVVPSGPDQTDAASNVSRQDPISAGRFDAKHLTRNRKVDGSIRRLGRTQGRSRLPRPAGRSFSRPARSA
jgi:hypothetical protein